MCGVKAPASGVLNRTVNEAFNSRRGCVYFVGWCVFVCPWLGWACHEAKRRHWEGLIAQAGIRGSLGLKKGCDVGSNRMRRHQTCSGGDRVAGNRAAEACKKPTAPTTLPHHLPPLGPPAGNRAREERPRRSDCQDHESINQALILSSADINKVKDIGKVNKRSRVMFAEGAVMDTFVSRHLSGAGYILYVWF